MLAAQFCQQVAKMPALFRAILQAVLEILRVHPRFFANEKLNGETVLVHARGQHGVRVKMTKVVNQFFLHQLDDRLGFGIAQRHEINPRRGRRNARGTDKPLRHPMRMQVPFAFTNVGIDRIVQKDEFISDAFAFPVIIGTR